MLNHDNYSGILTNQGPRILNFASFSCWKQLAPFKWGGGRGLLHINIGHLSLQLSALTVDQIAWFLNDLLSLFRTLSSGGVLCHIPPTIFPLLAPKSKVFFSSQERVCLKIWHGLYMRQNNFIDHSQMWSGLENMLIGHLTDPSRYSSNYH